MSVTVNNSTIQVYSCTYNFTWLIMLNLIWNDSWIQTFYRFILYKLPQFCGAHNTETMDALNKFLHFSYRVIVLSKYVVTILVSTDFAWWLPLTGLSWLRYAFACATCLVAPSSSGTIPDTHLLLVGWKIILHKSLFFTRYLGYLKNRGYCMAAHSSSVEKYFVSERNLWVAM